MITVKEVENVAKLARLALTDEEKHKLAEQMGNILEYFNQLSEVNTENVEPMAHPVPSINIMREDQVSFPYKREAILKNAPEEEDGYFKVPRITEE